MGACYWTAREGRGMYVNSGDLGFSVVVFLAVAVVCLVVLWARRRFLGYELGGKWKLTSGLVLVGLWVLYVLLCSMQSKGVINVVISGA